MSARQHHPQRGATAVEFALVAGAFFTILIGSAEISRALFYWNTAAELTRASARMAVVCDINDSAMNARIAALYPMNPAPGVTVDYAPASCTADTCTEVTVVVAAEIATMIPYVPLSLTLPSFRTTLPRESLASAGNPVCD